MFLQKNLYEFLTFHQYVHLKISEIKFDNFIMKIKTHSFILLLHNSIDSPNVQIIKTKQCEYLYRSQIQYKIFIIAHT